MEYDKIKIEDEAKEFLSQKGITFSQLFQILGTRKSSLLNIQEKELKEFINIYDKIENKEYEKQQKGSLLEQLSAIIFFKGAQKLLNVRKNCRTSTNEIDILLEWTEEARILNLNNSYSCFGENFICECKNYNGPVGVTYVGKFCSLLRECDAKLGIMISWEGVTGKGNWDSAKGLIKKIALKEKIYVVVLDKNDLKEIYENRNNIFQLVYEKYNALKLDIEYSKYIVKHEAEDELKMI